MTTTVCIPVAQCPIGHPTSAMAGINVWPGRRDEWAYKWHVCWRCMRGRRAYTREWQTVPKPKKPRFND